MNPNKLELYKLIIKVTPIPIQIWEKWKNKFTLVYFNKATTDWGIDILNNMTPQELYKTTSDILEDFNSCISQKEDFYREMVFSDKNTGKEKELSLTCRFIPPNLIGVFVNDNIQQKISEKILKKAEREKSLILNSIAELVIFQDTNHNIIWTNKAAANSINMKVNDLIGKKCYSLWCNPEGLVPIKECPIQISIDNKIEVEAEVKTSDGRVWHIKGYSVIDETNKLIGAVEVTNEITQLRLTQKNLEISEKRYREAYNRTRFYKDLFAHDINNILQNILSSAELLALNSEKSINKECDNSLIDIIKQQLNRGTKLASNVRKLSDLEDSENNLDKIDIIKILKENQILLVDAFPQKDIHINMKSDYNELYILANDLVNEVFENILNNSVYHNINSIIEIEINISKEIKDGKKFIKLEFIDNGVGIFDANKQKVFTRGELEVETISGSGLGLKLVKKLVDIYNGKIWIEDKIKGDHSLGSKSILLFPEAI